MEISLGNRKRGAPLGAGRGKPSKRGSGFQLQQMEIGFPQTMIMRGFPTATALSCGVSFWRDSFLARPNDGVTA